MKINDAMRIYRLPNPTTPEDLECRWSKLLTFGDRVVIAGYFFNGPNKPCYFGAAYEFLGDDHTCEGAIGLRAASGAELLFPASRTLAVRLLVQIVPFWVL